MKSYVDVERFLECCKACPNYGKVWSCAPYDFDPMEIWNSYEKLDVISYRITFGANRNREEMIEIEWVEGDSLPEHFVLVGGLLMTGEYNS